MKNARITKIFACQMKNARITKIFVCQMKNARITKISQKFFFDFLKKTLAKVFSVGIIGHMKST